MLGFDPLASPQGMTIPRCVANADGAIAIIREHRAKWLLAQQPTGRA
jgi:hypothetical protein